MISIFLSLFSYFCVIFFTQAQFLSHTRSQQAVRVTVYIISVEMLLSDGICAFSYTHVSMYLRLDGDSFYE